MNIFLFYNVSKCQINSTFVWTGGIRSRAITQKLGKAIDASVQNDRRGLVVDECMRVKGAPENTIFAFGDCAFSGKPPTAQVASQQGKLFILHLVSTFFVFCIECPK